MSLTMTNQKKKTDEKKNRFVRETITEKNRNRKRNCTNFVVRTFSSFHKCTSIVQLFIESSFGSIDIFQFSLNHSFHLQYVYSSTSFDFETTTKELIFICLRCKMTKLTKYFVEISRTEFRQRQNEILIFFC